MSSHSRVCRMLAHGGGVAGAISRAGGPVIGTEFNHHHHHHTRTVLFSPDSFLFRTMCCDVEIANLESGYVNMGQWKWDTSLSPPPATFPPNTSFMYSFSLNSVHSFQSSSVQCEDAYLVNTIRSHLCVRQ
jgi:hypothetical protein